MKTANVGVASATRKGCTPIKVYCLPEERTTIEGLAKISGHSVSTYLRLVGQGARMSSVLDHECVRELAKINADLGRLGGLLKLWLADESKFYSTEKLGGGRMIADVLKEIRANQERMYSAVQAVKTHL